MTIPDWLKDIDFGFLGTLIGALVVLLVALHRVSAERKQEQLRELRAAYTGLLESGNALWLTDKDSDHYPDLRDSFMGKYYATALFTRKGALKWLWLYHDAVKENDTYGLIHDCINKSARAECASSRVCRVWRRVCLYRLEKRDDQIMAVLKKLEDKQAVWDEMRKKEMNKLADSSGDKMR